MAGTLPHAVFVETGAPPEGAVIAYAAELPGCAAIGHTVEEAVAAIPARVAAFTAWLRERGQPANDLVGNWYEVERMAVSETRAIFSLDELDPSPAELAAWLEWLELAREDLAGRLDADPELVNDLAWLPAQDRAMAAVLDRGSPGEPAADPIDEVYAARDRLMAALSAGRSGVRAALRIAIADDLRAAS